LGGLLLSGGASLPGLVLIEMLAFRSARRAGFELSRTAPKTTLFLMKHY